MSNYRLYYFGRVLFRLVCLVLWGIVVLIFYDFVFVRDKIKV